MRVLTTEGVVFAGGLSRGEASAVGRHWNAVRRYLETGDEADLARLEGATVGGRELETRTGAIEAHAVRGAVEFESIYSEVTE